MTQVLRLHQSRISGLKPTTTQVHWHHRPTLSFSTLPGIQISIPSESSLLLFLSLCCNVLGINVAFCFILIHLNEVEQHLYNGKASGPATLDLDSRMPNISFLGTLELGTERQAFQSLVQTCRSSAQGILAILNYWNFLSCLNSAPEILNYEPITTATDLW